MPNAIAMTSEFNPRRRRATMVMIMFCGFSVGAALGGLLAAALIPQFGWRSVFVVGGLAPLVLAPVLALRLPESVRFLALTGHANDRVAGLLRLISPTAAFAPGTRFAVHEPHLPGIPVLHLFRQGRTLVTLLLWIVFFMSLLDIYFLSNWLPTVLNDLGASVSASAAIGSMLQVGGVVGTFALGSIIDRFSFRALALVYFIAGKLGLKLAFLHASASPVWPPAGIALAALVLLGYRVWPAIFVGAFLVNLTTAGNVATSLALDGHSVLLVDVDPQANLTSGVGMKGQRAHGGTAYEALMNENADPASFVLPTPL